MRFSNTTTGKELPGQGWAIIHWFGLLVASLVATSNWLNVVGVYLLVCGEPHAAAAAKTGFEQMVDMTSNLVADVTAT